MALDLTDGLVGQPLSEGIDYVWRVTGVAALKSQTGNLRLSVSATVAEGESVGQTASFPAYAFMIRDFAGFDAKTGQYIDRTKQLMANILGLKKDEIPDIPTKEGEVTKSMELLLNALFEAPAKWQPPTEEYDGRWFVGRVIRPIDNSEVVPPDWAALFGDDAQNDTEPF